MTFFESIKTCFSKYADFNGRASRSEYWWFFLFTLLVSMSLSTISGMLRMVDWLGTLFSFVVLLPSIAVAARRLHDTNRSGWWQLLLFIPIIGWIILIVMLVQAPRDPNRFDPLPSRGPCGW